MKPDTQIAKRGAALGVAVGRDGADDHAQEVWVLDHPGPKRFRNRRRRHVAVPRADSADDEDVPMDRTQPPAHRTTRTRHRQQKREKDATRGVDEVDENKKRLSRSGSECDQRCWNGFPIAICCRNFG